MGRRKATGARRVARTGTCEGRKPDAHTDRESIAIFAAITAVAALPQLNAGHPSIWGDIMAFAGMVLGIPIVIRSQERFVSQHGAPASEGTIEGTQS